VAVSAVRSSGGIGRLGDVACGSSR
jgi:hypothetical protein